MRAGVGGDELGVDLLHVDALALVSEGGVAGDDEAAGQMREVGREIVGDPIGEIAIDRRGALASLSSTDAAMKRGA
jgi:hypothetical protein